MASSSCLAQDFPAFSAERSASGKTGAEAHPPGNRVGSAVLVFLMLLCQNATNRVALHHRHHFLGSSARYKSQTKVLAGATLSLKALGGSPLLLLLSFWVAVSKHWRSLACRGITPISESVATWSLDVCVFLSPIFIRALVIANRIEGPS